MKKLYLITILMIAISIFCVCAYTSPIDAPFETGSWGQLFQESASGYGLWNMNFMQAKIFETAGTLFEGPAFRNFTTSGWTASPASGNSSLAWVSRSFSVANTEFFDVFFTGTPSDGWFGLTFQAYDQGVQKESYDLYWNPDLGGSRHYDFDAMGIGTSSRYLDWGWKTGDTAGLGSTAVPEPGTILAACSILAPVGYIFRRRKI